MLLNAFWSVEMGSVFYIVVYNVILHFQLNSWPFSIISVVPGPGLATGLQSNCHPKKVLLLEHLGSMSHIAAYVINSHFRLNS